MMEDNQSGTRTVDDFINCYAPPSLEAQTYQSPKEERENSTKKKKYRFSTADTLVLYAHQAVGFAVGFGGKNLLDYCFPKGLDVPRNIITWDEMQLLTLSLPILASLATGLYHAHSRAKKRENVEVVE